MLATCGDVIKFWDSTTFELKQSIPGSHGNVNKVVWNNDGSCLASVCDNSKEVNLKVVKGSSALDLAIVKAATSNVNAISYANHRPHYLAIGECKSRVILWDVKQNIQQKLYQIPEAKNNNNARLSCITFNPSDSHIASGRSNGDVHLMSLSNNTITGPHQLFSDMASVQSLTYSGVKTSLLGGTSSSGGVCCLDVNSGAVTKLHQQHAAPAHSLAFSPINEILLISVGYDKKMFCHNLNTGKIAHCAEFDAPLTCVNFIPGGMLVCLGTLTGDLIVQDLRNMKTPVKRWQAHSVGISTVALQPEPKVKNKNKKSSSGKKLSARAVTSDHTPAGLNASKGKENKHPNEAQNYAATPVTQNKKITSQDILDTEGLLSPVKDMEPLREGLQIRTSDSHHTSMVSLTPSLHQHRMLPHEKDEVDDEMHDDILSPVRSCLTPVQSHLFHTMSAQHNLNVTAIESDVTSASKVLTFTPSATVTTSSISTAADCSSVASSGLEVELLSPLRKKQAISLARAQSAMTASPVVAATNFIEHNKINDSLHSFSPQVLTPSNTPVCTDKRYNEDKKIDVSRSDQDVRPVVDNNTTHNKDYCNTTFQRRYRSIVSRLNEETKEEEATEKECSSRGEVIDLEKLAELVAQKLSSKESNRSSSSSSGGAPTAESLSLALVRNSVKDVLEEVEAGINRRFMHLHYTLLTHLMQQTKEMEELHKKYSLNDALLEENMKLQEEIKHLRSTY